VRVLWIHFSGLHRWDALLLMKVTADKGEEQYRMMWLRDAFGQPLLEDAKSGQPWEWPDVLEWESPDSQDTTLTYARTIEDLQRSWSYTLRHSTNALSCAFPETDVGRSYRFDPDLGLGSVIENVGVDVDDDGTMAWALTPEEFRKSKVIAKRNGFVWAQTPNGLGVASRANWDRWTVKFKNTTSKP
ncbi:MAG TPA: hypothetical protein VNV60_07640, partial [Holophagaceae bacterium]|nr:hypothetical protein [Holophagaceae bacterium]